MGIQSCCHDTDSLKLVPLTHADKSRVIIELTTPSVLAPFPLMAKDNMPDNSGTSIRNNRTILF
jgi:hypothetical protein